MWCSQGKIQLQTCMTSKGDVTNLWHRKLDYLNLRSMRKITLEKAIIGPPILKIKEGKIYGDCRIGK